MCLHQTSGMGSMVTSDGVEIKHLHFQERSGKDQRKTQMLRVNRP